MVLVEEGFGDLFKCLLLLFGAVVNHVGLFVHENLSPHEFYESWTINFRVNIRDFARIPPEQAADGGADPEVGGDPLEQGDYPARHERPERVPG